MKYNTEKSILPILWMAILIKGAIIFMALILPVDLQDYSPVHASENFTPEIWLSLMAFVFGTLIIVVSIASEKTPKLIDLFVTEYWSCLFIWLIALCNLENIFLHFVYSGRSPFINNIIFLNNYVLLPGFIVAAIPYIFYILKYTKSSSVIKRIYANNIHSINAARKVRSAVHINENHFMLLESINQLHDLLQFIQFKEPQADIINKLGKSLRHYLEQKSDIPEPYFKISNAIKDDVSFSTLSDQYMHIQLKKTFYEQKILRVLGASYSLLVRDSHHDLASLCGHELFETGKTAVELQDHYATDTIIIYFNTMLRFGINNGIKAREIRNVYNTIFHYSKFVEFLIEKRLEARIIQCCRYFRFYANEIRKVSQSEPIFFFLVEAFAVELKNILIAIHNYGFSRKLQATVLKIFNELSSQDKRSHKRQRLHDNGLRLIQIALCLFYIKQDEMEFNGLIVDSMIRDMQGFDMQEAALTIQRACDQVEEASEDFWEETDRGSQNIYYSPDKSELKKLHSYFSSKLTRAKNMVPDAV